MMLTTKRILKQTFLLCAVLGLSQAAVLANEHVIVGFHQQPTADEQKIITDLGGTVEHTYSLLPALAAEIPYDALELLSKNPKVSYIEYDRTLNAIDPIFSSGTKEFSNKAFSIQAEGIEYQNAWGVEHIGAKVAHDQNITGKDIKIAILDTGINYNHTDLDANYRGGHNFIENGRASDDPFDDSFNQHGTNIAGIIAAEANGVGVIGVAPNASIYAVKVLDGGTFGSLSNIISGIEWAVDNKMDIVNISIAGSDSALLQAACEAAEQAGLLIVAAGGNTYSAAAQYPASYPSVIAVAGTNKDDTKGYFSPIDPILEIAAPGLGIYSTAQDNSYAELSGTSQSAAFVTGAAALLLSHGVTDLNDDGIVNNRDVRIQLQQSVTDLGEKGRDDEFGYGLLNIGHAFETPNPLSLHLKKKNSWSESVEQIHLKRAFHTLTLHNNGLIATVVLIYDAEGFRGDLTKFYFFKGTNDELNISLDATDTALDVSFIPLGEVGASVDISITQSTGDQ